MHNRARMIVASFLTKDLGIDWRLGAAHFLSLLVDGDLANNAATGSGSPAPATTPAPTASSTRCARRAASTPSGDYVRRYVPELAEVEGPAVHEPWRLDADARRGLDYPDPIVHHAEAARASRARRVGGMEQPRLFDD